MINLENNPQFDLATKTTRIYVKVSVQINNFVMQPNVD